MAAALLTCMGCSDWLDVNPRTELKQEVLYQTEEGYKETLTGVYIQMASEDLYGKNTSMYFTDMLLRLWKQASPTQNADYYIRQWDFKNATVEPVIEDIWKAYYRCIVHLNDILGHIDNSKNLFENNNYNLIKGEALGLRGFLHLELLRLFGPVPDKQAGNKAAIPYAEEMTKDPGKLRTLNYDEVCRKIIRDLNAAEELLKDDPLTRADNMHLNDPSSSFGTDMEKPNDKWHFYRQVRFNYYAVKGAKARFYHWIGDTDNALKYASEVIESGKFRLTNSFDYTSSRDYEVNLVMLSEHLFGVDVPNLQTIVQPLFKNEEPSLTQDAQYITIMYESQTNDIRNATGRYWIMRNNKNHFLKYTGNDNVSAYNQVPVLRLAEMYLIMIEDSPLGTADSYWEDFVVARGLPESWRGSLTTDPAKRSRMEKEWRKEFAGEGQAFFYYKRNAYTECAFPAYQYKFTFPDPAFNIPRPQSQTVFD